MIQAPGSSGSRTGSWEPIPVDPLFALVDSVDGVHVDFTEGETPAAVISVRGTVRTGGWPFAILAPKLSTSDDKDTESLDFFFLGRVPPKGSMVVQRVTPIAATLVIQLPSWVKTIQVKASTNEKSAPLRTLTTMASGTKTQGGPDYFPW